MIPKFRAWDRTRNEMNYRVMVGNCDTNDENWTCPSIWVEDKQRWVHFDDYECIMQSTGLHDKNGKEIFEGDIIRTSVYGCIVGFGEYTYFEDENSPTTEIGFYLSFLNVKPATYAPFDKYYWANCEAIGNIYENELDLIVYEAYKYNKSNEDK